MHFWMSVLSLFISFILACQCSHLARRKGRNPTGWFFAGAALGVFALLILALLPVRRTAPVMTRPSPSTETPFQALSTLHTDKFWYFLDEHKKQYGPMSFSALKAAWHAGTVRKKTFVWNEEMENWKPLQDVIRCE